MHNIKSKQYTPIVKLAKTVLIANGMYIHFLKNANQKAIRIVHMYTTRHKDSSSKNLNKTPSTLSPNNVFQSNDSRCHSSRTASVMKVQRSKNSYFSNWFDYHDLLLSVASSDNLRYFCSWHWKFSDHFFQVYQNYTLIEYFLFELMIIKYIPCLEITIVLDIINWIKFKSLLFLSHQYLKINQNLNFDQWECRTLKLD